MPATLASQVASSPDPRRSPDSTFDFLDAYADRTWSNDDGALLGQLEMWRAMGAVERFPDELLWWQAMSCALSAT